MIEIPGDTLGINATLVFKLEYLQVTGAFSAGGVEPGVAAPFAALLTGRWVPERGARIGVVLCGANVVNATMAPPQVLV